MAVLMTGCLLASGRSKDEAAHPATLDAARMHTSSAAPVLPIFVLRLARDDAALSTADRAAVAMIVDEAEVRSHPIIHARAAYLEILAQSVDEGSLDESQVALYAEQVAWATDEAVRPLQSALLGLFDLLTLAQRTHLVSEAQSRLATWAPMWATDTEHRWLASFPERELPDFSGDLRRTARGWTDKGAANVRAKLPRLDPNGRRALATSLRTGRID